MISKKKENSSVNFFYIYKIIINKKWFFCTIKSIDLVRNDFICKIKVKSVSRCCNSFLIINSYKKVNHNIAFDEKISLGHNNKMGAKDNEKVKTYKILI